MSGTFVVAGSDATKLLEFIKEALDQIALAVEHIVAGALDFAVGLRWDDDLGPAGSYLRNNGIAVIAFIAQHGVDLEVLQ